MRLAFDEPAGLARLTNLAWTPTKLQSLRRCSVGPTASADGLLLGVPAVRPYRGLADPGVPTIH